MHFRPSSRSSTRSTHSPSPAMTMNNTHMNIDAHANINAHNLSPSSSSSPPLQTISSNTPGSRAVALSTNSTQKLFRNSASQVMRTIMDSPRRAFFNKKKRLNAHNNKNQNDPGGMEIMIKSSPMLQKHGDEDFSLVHTTTPCINTNNGHSIANINPTLNMNMSLFWLEYQAPQDIIPKVLSFAGPQMIQILSRVSKSWNEICLSEAVFRTLCEDTGKWVKGKHPEPHQSYHDIHGKSNNDAFDEPSKYPKEAFWRNYYRNNPIVPLDYRTIPDVMAAVCTRKRFKDQTYYECDHNVRILLHPTLYTMKRRIVVESIADATFAVESHNHFSRRRFDAPNSIAPLVVSPSSPRSRCNSDGSASTSPPATTKRRLNGPGLREIFTCRSSLAAEDTSDEGSRRSRNAGMYNKREATIVLRTKIDNTPIFHIRQGRMRLSKLNLMHECSGVDIWNGNAAVQIQPRHEERPNQAPHPIMPQAPNRPPSALIEDSKIMSVSGRGIVAIDGSAAFIRKCHIYKCAATGIYVGGPGSIANVTVCDVVQNGIGNTRTGRRRPRGRIIARGHSGVYLEQGRAVLQDCNISKNALTGISAVSATNAFLTVSDSDIVGNGTLQLELPPSGSISYRKAKNVNNHISNDGQARVRSGFKLNDMDEPETSTSEDDYNASSSSELDDW